MRLHLSAAQGRLAALLLVSVCAGFGYAALVQPLVSAHRHFDERIAELNHRLGQYKKSAKERESTERLLEQRKRADAARQYYLAERNPALASAELQGLVKRAVEQGKGELVSTQVLSAQRASEVTVKAQVRGDIRTVQRTLYALEAARPLLFVSSLSVASATPPRILRPVAAVPGKDLVINLDVSGYMRERAP
jgi:general secretion pathway protein M